ncbi:MAG: dTDP-4-dehydrorhamnose 3,5-epimerase [Gemmatimonadaceae bacterium]
MRITPTALPEVLRIEPNIHTDERGFLVVSFDEREFADAGLPAHFAQDNHSHSVSGVIRALHFQGRSPQGKLVTPITGDIFDVAVDIRVGSPTFGKWTGATLRASEPRYMWIPPGFAHGFAVLSDFADVVYKCTTLFEPDHQLGVRWDDPAIGIPWPVANPILSAADRKRPFLHDMLDSLPRFVA